ncbi:MgtC/SapB family protein [Marilutibacter aestuarii]|uniref:MgtC/SapB family protein n=1 Tax=Marilutibacter aestuarii TaxID=1706195 RepID=A0A508AAB7_9GAMM|nr:DUF4010 domain-containing protein [Lysobacter aestuarii]TQD45444.1 MgtC/SapB family protein [Lysobacter aestuarii]
MEIGLQGITTAAAIGLLIGLVRERHADHGAVAQAGIRTHALIAIAAAVAIAFGPWVLAALMLGVGALAVAGYRQSRAHDPGLTGEVTLLTTPLLAALAQSAPTWAAGLAVVVAGLLFAKAPLQGFARRWLAEREVQDGLMLAAAALVVLPLLPDRPVDPWGVLVPSVIWRLVVLVMGVGLLGHLALRLVGARWGLPLAGFLSGFASSTAAVASFGQQARQTPARSASAASAALLANLASLLLLAAIVGATSPALLRASAWPLAVAGLVVTVAALPGLRDPGGAAGTPPAEAPAFHVGHALLLGLVFSAVLLASAGLNRLFGDAGAMVAAMLVALAELHPAAASIAQLAGGGELEMGRGRIGLAALLVSAGVAKSVIAFASGTRRYAVQVAAGLAVMATAGVAIALSMA